MKKHLSVGATLSSLFVISCAVGIISFQGCQKQDYAEELFLDPVVLNSPELEAYIIAGAEYRQASNTFVAELSKIDFSKLKFEEDQDGKKVMRIPVTRGIEKKAMNLQEKRDALLGKYPEFALLDKDRQYNYFHACIKKSPDINRRLLELGININQLTTKGMTTEKFSNMNDLAAYVSAQVSSNDYKEIVIVVYKDGRIETYQDDSNTSSSFSLTMEYTGTPKNGTFYYPKAADANDNIISRNEVRHIAHTHLSGIQPSDSDLIKAAKYPGLPQGVYFDGEMKIFNQ